MATTEKQLRDAVAEKGSALDVPGISVGVYHAGEEHYAFHGVTNVENPLEVDETTLFQFGSTGKTFTAAAMMRLVEQGKVNLDDTVRTYVPELKLRDESVAEKVTVLQLLNHTAGWEGDRFDDTGEGDDAIERFVAEMATLQQVTPLGTAMSYNNASFALAGHVIAKVTGMPWEHAIRSLLLEPLGLENTRFISFTNDFVTYRFAVGHNRSPEGDITVSRKWLMSRGSGPAGHMLGNAADQIAWAKFHLGDGAGVLSKASLDLMKEPTFDMRGSALGDYVGISWLLRDVDGVRLVSHGGSTYGQYSSFVLVPERDMAVISMTNCGPNGSQFNREIVRWALEHYAGVNDKEPEAVALSDEALAKYVGDYETVSATVAITAADGYLSLEVAYKPETLESMRASGDDIPDKQPPVKIGLLGPDSNDYVVVDGAGQGMRGYFAVDDAGAVEGAHFGGRLATRVRR